MEVGKQPIFGRKNGADPGGSRRFWIQIGGRYKDRTCDPFHVKEVLYR